MFPNFSMLVNKQEVYIFHRVALNQVAKLESEISISYKACQCNYILPSIITVVVVYFYFTAGRNFNRKFNM